jgi:hypothetical protein
LYLSSEKLVSKFAFKCNLYRYNTVLLRGVEDFLEGAGVIFTYENRPKKNLGIISGTVSSSSTAAAKGGK